MMMLPVKQDFSPALDHPTAVIEIVDHDTFELDAQRAVRSRDFCRSYLHC